MGILHHNLFVWTNEEPSRVIVACFSTPKCGSEVDVPPEDAIPGGDAAQVGSDEPDE